jgi:3'-phosphoadenosine 5'-phosphosulfate sulfotransferase (PAPS reductase)/FAD synthetase
MDQRRLIEARAILDEAIEVHRPTHIFGMLSGGHDSLSATHFVSQYPQFSGAVHINTGIGIRQTREFVYETCRREGWMLKEYRPPVSYREIVLRHGFPGPGGHFYMYVRLKERCIEQLIREHKKKRKDRIMLVTGVRLDESDRRMGHVEPIVRVKSRVWVAPILNWSTEDKNDYIDGQRLPRNPVVDQLCMSGECLCGSFAKEGEIVEIEAAFPEAAAEIAAIEAEARAAGVHAKWGTRPPKDQRPVAALPMELCWSCNAKHASDLADAAE